MMTKTIKFNVGGKRFEVGWSTLEMHPESLLTKMASDSWAKERKMIDPNQEKGIPQVSSSVDSQVVLVCNESESSMEFITSSTDSEFFIDRDGEVFSYVLNYLRDLKVSLPLQLTKAALIAELEFYNVARIHKENIDESERKLLLATHMFNDGKQSLLDTAESFGIEGEAKIFAGSCYLLAKYCVRQYVNQRTIEDSVVVEVADKDFPCLNKQDMLKAVQTQCNTQLNNVGLHISSLRCLRAKYSGDCDKYDCQEHNWKFSVEAVVLV